MGAERLIVNKFGGSSVDSAASMRQSAQIIAEQFAEGNRIVAVPSAIARATNELYGIVDVAVRGDNYVEALDAFAQRQSEINNALTDGDDALRVQDDFGLQINDAAQTLGEIKKTGKPLPWQVDRIASLGERASSKTFAAILREAGVSAVSVDATAVIATDDKFGNANPDLEQTRRNFQEHALEKLSNNTVVVIGGFHGATTMDGEAVITTLGRGGSDYAATLLTAAAHGMFVNVLPILWKADYGGVYSADPRVVSDARLVRYMTYPEAAALAGIGGNVIHPKAINPIREKNIPLQIKSTLYPDRPGTEVAASIPNDDVPIKAVTSLKNLRKLSVEGSGMHEPNIAGLVTSAIGGINGNIRFIAQPISESTMIFGLDPLEDEDAISDAVMEALAEQIASNNVDRGALKHEKVAAIAMIGFGVRLPQSKQLFYRGMQGTPEYPVNPLPGDSSSGSHEASTLIIDFPGNADNAVNAVHGTIF